MAEIDSGGLRRQIEIAFAHRPYPGDDGIALTQPGCPGYEGDDVRALLAGRDWRDLSWSDLYMDPRQAYASLGSFMTVPGFAYYLPAFLLLAIESDPDDTGLENAHRWTFIESVCFRLTRPSPTSLADQYAMVRDLEDVPEEIKAALRDPTPEARAAERRILQDHQRLLELLTASELAAVRGVLEYLVPLLRDDQLGDRFNQAARALESVS